MLAAAIRTIGCHGLAHRLQLKLGDALDVRKEQIPSFSSAVASLRVLDDCAFA